MTSNHSAAALAGHACDTAAEWCSPSINFHTDPQAAGQAFGGLLDRPNPQEIAP